MAEYKKKYGISVTDWPQIRIHPKHHARLQRLSSRQSRSLNALLYMILEAFFKAVDDEKQS